MKACKHHTRIAGIAVPLLLIALTSCMPWTVRPIDGGREGQLSAVSPGTDPGAYVESIWATRLVPAVTGAAVEARTLLDALHASPPEARTRYGRPEGSGAAYFIVKGEGVVTAVDTRSRVGLALIDVAPLDGRADMSIQIGPVIRGTSLRDATGVVQFSDFVNQLQFADAGNEINERVLKTVLAPIDAGQLKRRRVTFAGTVSAAESPDVPLAELVPLMLRVEDVR